MGNKKLLSLFSIKNSFLGERADHTDQILDKQSKAASYGQSSVHETPLFSFSDNRPEAAVQLKLQEIADNSSQVQRATYFQNIAKNSPPLQLSVGGVAQFDWTEKDGDNYIDHPDKPPPGEYKKIADPRNSKKIVWVKKVAVAPPPSYEDKVGALPARDNFDAEFTVDASLIKFSQDSISSSFQDDGDSLATTIASLRAGRLSPNDLPAIRVTMRKGRLVSLDNRRLYCCKEAGVQIRCVWATAGEIEKRDFTAGENGAATITVRK